MSIFTLQEHKLILKHQNPARICLWLSLLNHHKIQLPAVVRAGTRKTRHSYSELALASQLRRFSKKPHAAITPHLEYIRNRRYYNKRMADISAKLGFSHIVTFNNYRNYVGRRIMGQLTYIDNRLINDFFRNTAINWRDFKSTICWLENIGKIEIFIGLKDMRVSKRKVKA